TSPLSVAVGDLNGDGVPDLAVANDRSNDVSVLRGTGDGTFQAAVDVPLPAGSNPSSVAVGDFDGDGKPDLAVAIPRSNHVLVLLGTGEGTFQAALAFAAGSHPVSVAVGGVTGDGKLDLAVGNTTCWSCALSVLMNDTPVPR